MNPFYRRATTEDIPRLFEVRNASILALATKGMSVQQTTNWASRQTLETLKERFVDAEFWVAESANLIMGWICIRGDQISGLYVEPASGNRGIGSGLLRLAEGIMLSAGVNVARLDASWSSETFYVRHGYIPTGPRPSDDARSFSKPLTASASFVQRDRPTLVMLAGLPGTGKTTLAYAIARALRWIVLDKDLINTPLINALNQSSAGPLSYDVLLDLAEDLVVVQRHSLILDTAGRQRLILDGAMRIAQRADATLRVIRCIAPPALRLSRLTSRYRLPSQWAKDDTTESQEAQWYAHLPPDALTVNSTRPVDELLPRVLDFLFPKVQ